MKCPKCGFENPEDAKFCASCTGNIDELAKQRKCPVCGDMNPKEAKYCKNCASDMNASIEEQKAETAETQAENIGNTFEDTNSFTPKPPKKNKVLIITLIAIIIVLLVVVIFMVTGSKNKTEEIVATPMPTVAATVAPTPTASPTPSPSPSPTVEPTAEPTPEPTPEVDNEAEEIYATFAEMDYWTQYYVSDRTEISLRFLDRENCELETVVGTSNIKYKVVGDEITFSEIAWGGEYISETYKASFIQQHGKAYTVMILDEDDRNLSNLLSGAYDESYYWDGY